jgi:dihydrofolate reductase
MSKLIVSEFVTLDGVMESPGGEETHPHAGWVIEHAGPEQIDYKTKEIFEAEALLIGRITYEGFAASWPHRDGEFADKMNSMPKYVVSSRIAEPLEWNNSTVVKGDVAKEITRLKEQDGGPLLVAGSATLVRALIEHDLVDELRLMVFPVMVGGGLRAFPESRDKKLFELTDVTRFPTGVAVHTYRPASAPLAEDGARALRDVGVDVDVDRMRATTGDG